MRIRESVIVTVLLLALATAEMCFFLTMAINQSRNPV